MKKLLYTIISAVILLSTQRVIANDAGISALISAFQSDVNFFISCRGGTLGPDKKGVLETKRISQGSHPNTIFWLSQECKDNFGPGASVDSLNITVTKNSATEADISVIF